MASLKLKAQLSNGALLNEKTHFPEFSVLLYILFQFVRTKRSVFPVENIALDWAFNSLQVNSVTKNTQILPIIVSKKVLSI